MVIKQEKNLISTDEYIKGKGYQKVDHLYLSIPIEVDGKQIAGIKTIVKSHDQGWTAHERIKGTYSDHRSRGEVGILDSEGKEKEIPRKNIYINLNAVSDWQTHEKIIFEPDFLNQIKKGDKVGIWLRSDGEGWENYAQKGEIRLFEKGIETEEWLEENYPKEERSEIKKIDACGLKGKLDLSVFVNLEELNLHNNEFTSLDLSKCSKVKKVDCSWNKLTNIKFNEGNNLEELDCSNNELTSLDLGNCPQLQKINCSNNQLEDIIFPPDADKLIASEVIIRGNKLEYKEIDKKFLKYLPILAKSEIKAIEKEEFEKIIREKANIHDTIEKIDIFPAWWNPNCALVINKVAWQAMHLIIYEPPIKNQETKKEEILEILKVIKISEHPIHKEKFQNEIKELKEKLNSDNPVLAIYSNTNFSPEEIIKTFELPEEAKQEPEKYLRPGDMIWRNMKGLPTAYHVAVYLGNKRVAHIGSSKFIKAEGNLISRTKSDKQLLGARNDHWTEFLHSTDEEQLKLFRHHLIIPFQRPEKVQEHLTKAIVGNYGAETYKLLSQNCEHFATLCVTGVPFSTQADKWVIADRLAELFHHKDLAKVIKDCEEHIIKEVDIPFEYWFKLTPRKYLTNKIQETKEKFITNRKERIKTLENKTELTAKEQQLLIQFQWEVNSLEENSQKLATSSANSEADNSISTPLLPLPLEIEASCKQIIQQKANISGTIEKITPLENNQVLVINKVIFYAVRLFEYKENELTELKRYAKNKFGYSTLEDAQQKVNKIIAKLNQTETTTYIEIPPK